MLTFDNSLSFVANKCTDHKVLINKFIFLL